MLDHVSMLREFCAHFIDPAPVMAGLEDCESLFTHHRNKKLVAEKFLVRPSSAIQQALEMEESGHVYWVPDLENPADGLMKTRSDVAPFPRLLEPGAFIPGARRPLQGVASCERLFVFFGTLGICL